MTSAPAASQQMIRTHRIFRGALMGMSGMPLAMLAASGGPVLKWISLAALAAWLLVLAAALVRMRSTRCPNCGERFFWRLGPSWYRPPKVEQPPRTSGSARVACGHCHGVFEFKA